MHPELWSDIFLEGSEMVFTPLPMNGLLAKVCNAMIGGWTVGTRTDGSRWEGFCW